MIHAAEALLPPFAPVPVDALPPSPPVVIFMFVGIKDGIGEPIKNDLTAFGALLVVRVVAIQVDVFGDQIWGYGHPAAGTNPIDGSTIPGITPPK